MKQQYPSQQFHYLFKYIVIGDSGVGKSSLMLQFLQNTFIERHEVTIGVEFGSKNIQVKDKTIKLQIWDTAGQEDYRSITRSYYRSAAGAILVYDVTNKQTFQNISSWIEEARSNGNPQMTFMLVGNKSDLENEREVTQAEGEEFAKSKGILFIESSAKSKQNIKEIFSQTAEDIVQKLENEYIDPEDNTFGVKLGTILINNKKKLTIKVQTDLNSQNNLEKQKYVNCSC